MTTTKADDIDACDGDQMLGIFMYESFAWANTTKAELTKINGTYWIGCSTNRWITERKPWGKKVRVSEHQFKRMLARGRKKGVLETCQWPSRFETGDDGQWKTVLHVRPADGYDQRRRNARLARCERATDALPAHGWCTAGALPMHHPDHNSGLRTSNLELAHPLTRVNAQRATLPPRQAFSGKSLRLFLPKAMTQARRVSRILTS